MNKTISFFQFIRWPNLLIVGLTQFVIWQFVVRPMHGAVEKEQFLSSSHFLLLCLSTIFIAAAGYMINDYFDIHIDSINKPNKIFVDKEFSKKTTLFLYALFNSTGLLPALILAWKINHPQLIIIQLICILFLYLYSKKWKKEFLIGNIIVAVLAALTVLLVPLYEPAMYAFLQQSIFKMKTSGEKILNPMLVIIFYAFFAFMLTWIREIIKDMEDLKGDAENDCHTMPIKMGIPKTKNFIMLIGLLTLLPLFLATGILMIEKWWILGVYLLLFLILPLLYFLFFLFSKSGSRNFKTASIILKLIMITGIFSLVLYKSFYSSGAVPIF